MSPPPTSFGEHVTGDWVVAKRDFSRGRRGESNRLVLYDVGAEWLYTLPSGDREAGSVGVGMGDFEGPKHLVEFSYSDDAPEHTRAAADLGWKCHGASTPGRPDTNGLAESKVDLDVARSSALLLQAGMEPHWSPFATIFLYFPATY